MGFWLGTGVLAHETVSLVGHEMPSRYNRAAIGSRLHAGGESKS